MAVVALRNKDLVRVIEAVPKLLNLPATRMWIDYDTDADVLYISFQRPQRADDSELRDDGVIIHRRRGRIVGISVLEASTR